jgi:hypothetical protein
MNNKRKMKKKINTGVGCLEKKKQKPETLCRHDLSFASSASNISPPTLV